MSVWLQGEVWPNRCSEAIDEANNRVSGLCEAADHLHFLDIGQVSNSLLKYGSANVNLVQQQRLVPPASQRRRWLYSRTLV